ncbi:DMT family transporter [Amycolatopsis acidicola]|uniref:DMT family transporter n=1 Tax=Amycolatopsis acidicola TaxID=2596893 RepID=UPI00140B826D|nr:DMT family transporter [Amycolatopsis acidicola]
MTTTAPAPVPTRPSFGPLAVVLGALSLSASSVLIVIAGTSTATTAFWRCFFAVVMLAPVLVREIRRHGMPGVRTIVSGLLAGLCLGADFLLWNVSIGDVGAGIATVLVNMQIVLFPLVMWAVTRIAPPRRFLPALPVLLAAVALAGGLVGPAPEGDNPLRGTVLALAAALGYSGYLFFSRGAGVRSPRHFVTPVFFATASACLLAAVVGVTTSGIQLELSARAWIALAFVALTGQALGWLLVGWGLPRLAPAVSSALLLLQPVAAELLAVVVLGQVPTAVQIVGCVAVLATVWVLARGRPRSPAPGDD